MNRLAATLLLGLLLQGCQEEERRSEAKIQAAVAEELNDRQSRHFRQCRLNAVERASDIVDSLLLLEARGILFDPALAPIRPDRPETTLPDIEADTTRLQPLRPVRDQ